MQHIKLHSPALLPSYPPGNDLARCLGWGAGHGMWRQEGVATMLSEVQHAAPLHIDRCCSCMLGCQPGLASMFGASLYSKPTTVVWSLTKWMHHFLDGWPAVSLHLCICCRWNVAFAPPYPEDAPATPRGMPPLTCRRLSRGTCCVSFAAAGWLCAPFLRTSMQTHNPFVGKPASMLHCDSSYRPSLGHSHRLWLLLIHSSCLFLPLPLAGKLASMLQRGGSLALGGFGHTHHPGGGGGSSGGGDSAAAAGGPPPVVKQMNNYLGIGVDAKASLSCCSE